MRRIRYAVAASLDGYIAGPKGEAEWIILDPDIDFAKMFKEFDTVLLGRRTFEAMTKGGKRAMPGLQTFVFSRTLRQRDYPEVTVVADQAEKILATLRREPGKDIWLMGGGTLFRSLLEAGLVDTVEVSVVPVLLGAGIPLLPPPANEAKLELIRHTVYDTGIVCLQYAVKAGPHT
ncbi:MAG: dihydrofolate reductase family protein [Candidatus Sulfotelmatobacter sp.]